MKKLILIKIVLLVVTLLTIFVVAKADDKQVANKILKGENIQLSDTSHYEIQQLKNYTKLIVYHKEFKRIYLFRQDCIYSITEIFYNGVKYDAAYEN
jgi:hypothetical protein